ncbi:unnamed protein product [Allacma fusca]|uniref:Uncharacterized protein n=2 Tax=Allacma fusca TaxID=39272 RepID=A0A8J2PVT3_9HEXA|nr:unnamed protein product [Allacma fusca]
MERDPTAAPGLRSGLRTKYMAADIGSDGFIIFIVLAKPKSSGELTLASANPNEHPMIDPNVLSHPDDMNSKILKNDYPNQCI